jgi:hypothetical protein
VAKLLWFIRSFVDKKDRRRRAPALCRHQLPGDRHFYELVSTIRRFPSPLFVVLSWRTNRRVGSCWSSSSRDLTVIFGLMLQPCSAAEGSDGIRSEGISSRTNLAPANRTFASSLHRRARGFGSLWAELRRLAVLPCEAAARAALRWSAVLRDVLHP